MLRYFKRAAGLMAALIALALVPGQVAEAQTARSCRALTATSEVMWYVSEEEPAVDFYPSGVESIEPYFEYSCVPKNTKIATVFTLDGEEVFSDSEAVPASNSPNYYFYPLTSKKGVMPDGEWGVTFLVNNKVVAEGSITVGGTGGEDPGPATTVQVGGTVTDKRTKKPIKGALFVVLNPGVTVQDFADSDFAEEHILTSATSDASGEFVLDTPLERNVEYSVVVAAKGYKPIAQDGFTITDEDPDPLILNVALVK
ncbi:MAG TPA: carboxypeptidase-like regulatory domain-containing protein [Roseiflexaceae bacterium]|nr:carboxypeptidase-like regulatory domain-containing protein [Roseiflexaceae bacterium]